MTLAALMQGAAATPDPAQINDIAPPVAIPLPPWIVVTAAVLALLLVVGAMVLILRWMKSRPAPPPPTPRAVALRELERLRSEVKVLEPYQFSIAVSDVLRTYIGAEYGLHAPQQTSPEFLASIAHAPKFTDSDRQLLGEFLEHCDLIKFARIDASVEDSTRLLESAIAFAQGGRA